VTELITATELDSDGQTRKYNRVLVIQFYNNNSDRYKPQLSTNLFIWPSKTGTVSATTDNSTETLANTFRMNNAST